MKTPKKTDLPCAVRPCHSNARFSRDPNKPWLSFRLPATRRALPRGRSDDLYFLPSCRERTKFYLHYLCDYNYMSQNYTRRFQLVSTPLCFQPEFAPEPRLNFIALPRPDARNGFIARGAQLVSISSPNTYSKKETKSTIISLIESPGIEPS
jgi:hypothetical protein